MCFKLPWGSYFLNTDYIFNYTNAVALVSHYCESYKCCLVIYFSYNVYITLQTQNIKASVLYPNSIRLQSIRTLKSIYTSLSYMAKVSVTNEMSCFSPISICLKGNQYLYLLSYVQLWSSLGDSRDYLQYFSVLVH